MCSSGGCDLPGLIAGPVGNIVGMGIKALLNGAPIGPRSAEALRTPTEKENIQQFYDKVEMHLKGALQILQPAMEIKKILVGECKSAEPARSVLTPAKPIPYYSPQNLQKSKQSSLCPSRCCGVKKSSSRDTEKSKTSKHSRSSTDKSSNAEITAKSIAGNSCSRKSTKSAARKCDPSFAGETSSKHSSSRHESKEKSCKVSSKSSKNKQAQCCLCCVSLKDNIALARLPCDHSFCYTCLAKAMKTRCQKCDNSYDMKNVTQMFFTD